MPTIGTMLKVTPNGDFLKVQDVYLDVTPGGEQLSLHIEDPESADDLWSWPEMKKEGWSLASD